MSIDEIRANANPVVTGDIDSFIKQYGPNLIVDIKKDGERGWISRDKDGETYAFNKHKSLYSMASHQDLLEKYFYMKDSFMIEGEICSLNGGIYSYLSDRATGKNCVFYAFDILQLNGVDLLEEPLEDRIKLLKGLNIVECPRFIVKSKEEILHIYDRIVSGGGEGIVLKSPKQKYGEAWIKIKREQTLDCVILGFKKKDKYLEDGLARSYRLGLYNGKDFVHIGDAGSGLKLFEKEAISTVLKATATHEDNEYVYTKPSIVVEIIAESKSEEAHLIHPRLKRIRTDKGIMDCPVEQLNLLQIRK